MLLERIIVDLFHVTNAWNSFSAQGLTAQNDIGEVSR